MQSDSNFPFSRSRQSFVQNNSMSILLTNVQRVFDIAFHYVNLALMLLITSAQVTLNKCSIWHKMLLLWHCFKTSAFVLHKMDLSATWQSLHFKSSIRKAVPSNKRPTSYMNFQIPTPGHQARNAGLRPSYEKVLN